MHVAMGRACGRSHLAVDQACLTVADTRVVTDVAAQSEECVGCPVVAVWHGGDPDVVVNTSFATFLSVTQEGRHRPCGIEYHFRQFGEYRLDVANDTAACSVSVISEEANEFLPILYSLK